MNNCIEIPINNKKTLRFSQSESDKARYGISLETINADGEVERRDLVSEEIIVNMVNRYRYVMDNDIQDNIINPNGLIVETDNEASYY